jgi:hypothetical protein
MKTSTRLIAFLATTMMVWAQSPENEEAREGHRPPQPPPHPLWIALDTDENGEISAEEIEAAAEALAKLDENEDGKITRDEVKPPKPPEDQLAPKMKRPPPLVEALDQDGDGKLSDKEIRDADDSLKTLDRNGDEEITGDEMFGPPPEGQNAPQGQGGGGQRPQRPMPSGPPPGGGRGRGR